MTLKIAVISQKGGVGKSTISRAIAVQIAHEKLTPLLADLDIKQKTSVDWGERRKAHPDALVNVDVQAFSTHDEALAAGEKYDAVVMDSKGYTDEQTADLCKKSDIIVHPCGFSLDDRKPTFVTLNTLIKLGIPNNKINIVLVGDRTASSEKEVRGYFAEGGYHVVEGYLRKKKTFETALDNGLSVTEASRENYRQEAITLVEAISKRLEVVL